MSDQNNAPQTPDGSDPRTPRSILYTITVALCTTFALAAGLLLAYLKLHFPW